MTGQREPEPIPVNLSKSFMTDKDGVPIRCEIDGCVENACAWLVAAKAPSGRQDPDTAVCDAHRMSWLAHEATQKLHALDR